jgi:phosphate transport system substrate-binding protein
MKVRLGAGLVLLSTLVAGCAAADITPPSYPRLVTQPFLEPVLVQWAEAYAQALGQPLPFDLDTRTRDESVDRIEEGRADLLVTSGEPPRGWFATPLGPQAVAVVVHPDNPVRDLSIEELRDLFAGPAGTWDEVGGRAIAAQPVLPLPGEPLGDAFAAQVLQGAAPWPGTLLAPTTGALAQLVAEEPGAIGVLPLAAVPDSLRAIRVEGVLPGETTIASGSYPLTVSLLATSPTEPQGTLRDFLSWLQALDIEG